MDNYYLPLNSLWSSSKVRGTGQSLQELFHENGRLLVLAQSFFKMLQQQSVRRIPEMLHCYLQKGAVPFPRFLWTFEFLKFPTVCTSLAVDCMKASQNFSQAGSCRTRLHPYAPCLIFPLQLISRIWQCKWKYCWKRKIATFTKNLERGQLLCQLSLANLSKPSCAVLKSQYEQNVLCSAQYSNIRA